MMNEELKESAFAAQNRELRLEEMARMELDLLVIGGGITGAGIALDAVTRGLRVAVVEMQDFAAGTSSRSTKLVHGGLRYLKQLEINVVAEVGKERAIVYENGPHVTTPEWMLLPLYKGGTFGKFSTSIGLRVYDFLAGVKKKERRKMLSAEEALRREPLLKREGLKGGGYYVEYRTDDARLTIEVMKRAVELGALAVNYAKVDNLLYDTGGVVEGAAVRDMISGQTYDVRAAKVINATGPWVDELREKDGSKHGKTLRLTKGVHLVFDGKRFPLKQAVYFDTPDGRMVFAIPREGKTYFGTTDTNFKGDTASPVMTMEDRDYLLQAANFMFPQMNLVVADVESSWAGLRPLIQQEGKSPSEISRRDEIFVSNSGFISIAGGKLTGYRKMAETVVDKAVELLRKDGGAIGIGRSETKELRMSGGDTGGSAGFEAYVAAQTKKGIAAGFKETEARTIAEKYGSNAEKLYELADETTAKWADSHKLPLALAVQLRYSIEAEMTAKPEDFFIRRTGNLFFRIAEVRKWKEAVIAAMAESLGWTAEQQAEYSKDLERKLAEAVEAPKQ
ncbi:glycerol-3-phosphate dehydrogenase/oxidase [Paenibacillus harenae]|uniref:glycerol-3-phosphate dehydrogenase/oxidase n=1 Tax=Paenibacillus harenae TaxID=306543 RepID=UPI002791F855|nr:FAD-dependent oxidoreductase [Paenibacillus harenae]MDQ0060056.1 glycerol-3-phosphate dehydrogenase [Paenibacillus harenae]